MGAAPSFGTVCPSAAWCTWKWSRSGTSPTMSALNHWVQSLSEPSATSLMTLHPMDLGAGRQGLRPDLRSNPLPLLATLLGQPLPFPHEISDTNTMYGPVERSCQGQPIPTPSHPPYRHDRIAALSAHWSMCRFPPSPKLWPTNPW